jgi:hypothetical protein
VARGRYWSYLCDGADCCEPEGFPIPDVPSPYVAGMTVEGTVALPDRQALAATLEPRPEAERRALAPLLDRYERVASAARGAGTADRLARTCRRELFAAVRADAPGLGDAEVARFGVALRSTAVRDALWRAVDTGRIDGRPLFRELARRLPAPYSAAPMFLFGWASWRRGNGALANVAAERTHAADPAYAAADMLLAALACGIDPRQLPPLGSRRARRAAGVPGPPAA